MTLSCVSTAESIATAITALGGFALFGFILWLLSR